MERVIFACVHNAARSQMAAAFFNALVDPAKAEAASAGTQPGDYVCRTVIAVMREVGIDISDKTPRPLTDTLVSGASLFVTMGCGEQCPNVPGVARDDWPLPDPKNRPADEVRLIRDDIRGRVSALIDARGWRRAEGN